MVVTHGLFCSISSQSDAPPRGSHVTLTEGEGLSLNTEIHFRPQALTSRKLHKLGRANSRELLD